MFIPEVWSVMCKIPIARKQKWQCTSKGTRYLYGLLIHWIRQDGFLQMRLSEIYKNVPEF